MARDLRLKLMDYEHKRDYHNTTPEQPDRADIYLRTTIAERIKRYQRNAASDQPLPYLNFLDGLSEE